MKEHSIAKMFARYVSRNVLGMVGISIYILADTFFIARAMGADGVAALNLVLPVYSLIFAIGSMLGNGAAIRYSLTGSRSSKEHSGWFFQAIFFSTLAGGVFVLVGVVFPDGLLRLLGGDDTIVEVGTAYTRTFLLFAPCFMWNYACNAFVRNEGAPSVAMAATLSGSCFNIVMDYILMFPLGMGMTGAALATGISPLVGCAICMIWLTRHPNPAILTAERPSLKRALRCGQLGASAFISEISSGITTAVFNYILLALAGNLAVAAYGVVANTSLVAMALFNGVILGAQPLLSRAHGSGNHRDTRTVLSLSLITALVMAVMTVVLVQCFAPNLTEVFNTEHSAVLAQYGETGLRIYFTGFLFASVNLIGTGALSATDVPGWAFILSLLRGVVLIVLCALVLSAWFGMNGVWLAFPVTEGICLILTVTIGIRKLHE